MVSKATSAYPIKEENNTAISSGGNSKCSSNSNEEKVKDLGNSS
ncbi:hypothetical protein [Candidatus Nitrosocosmicus sp. T]